MIYVSMEKKKALEIRSRKMNYDELNSSLTLSNLLILLLFASLSYQGIISPAVR